MGRRRRCRGRSGRQTTAASTLLFGQRTPSTGSTARNGRLCALAPPRAPPSRWRTSDDMRQITFCSLDDVLLLYKEPGLIELIRVSGNATKVGLEDGAANGRRCTRRNHTKCTLRNAGRNGATTMPVHRTAIAVASPSRRAAIVLVAFVAFLMVTGERADASRTINSVTLNGQLFGERCTGCHDHGGDERHDDRFGQQQQLVFERLAHLRDAARQCDLRRITVTMGRAEPTTNPSVSRRPSLRAPTMPISSPTTTTPAAADRAPYLH